MPQNNKKQAPKLLLLDGHSIARRAFHAQQKSGMSTSDGRPTYAIAGFMSMLAKMLSTSQPQYLGVVFDAPGRTFRHERLDTYKAQRKPPPQEFNTQLAELKELLAACAIEVMEVPEVEADDVLASYAEGAGREGLSVEIATGDRDSFQLIRDPRTGGGSQVGSNPQVSVLFMSSKGGPEYLLYDSQIVREKIGVAPEQYLDYAAMVGDTSDNLAGVPGVGAKTAAKLVSTHGDIEAIIAAADAGELPPKNTQAISDNRDVMRLNKEMMALLRDVELPTPIADLKRKPPKLDVLVPQLADLEFDKLADRIAEALGVPAEAMRSELKQQSDFLECEIRQHTDPAEAVAWLEAVAKSGGEADTRSGGEAKTKSGTPIGVSVALGKLDEDLPHGTAMAQRTVKGVAIYPVGSDAPANSNAPGSSDAPASPDAPADVPVSHWLNQQLYANSKVQTALKTLLAQCPVRTHGAKDWMRRLLEDDISVAHLQMDSELAGFLLDSASSQNDLRRMLKAHTGKTIPAHEPATGQMSLMDEDDSPSEADLSCHEAYGAALLHDPLTQKLAREGMADLLAEMELPLLGVIVKMEKLGMGVDPAELKHLRLELEAQVDQLREQIHAAAGKDFNVNSPKQLQEILFDELGLTPTRQTKRGYSTDAESLSRLKGEHPIVALLLEYREVEKLRSTYGEGLEKTVDPATDRIRASFNQTGSSTGRLSSEAPNLHNIPVRTELGRKFRQVFVAAEGSSLVVADYDQIELRCIAHLAQDKSLIEAFTAGQDVHVAVASQVFGVKADDVTGEQRSRAKAVSYGLAYGMEAYGLAQRLDLSNSEAQQIIDDYFGAFADVEDYMRATIKQARERGYTETLFGRRRRIPGLSADSAAQRHAAERQAMNSGIQGLAADIFKVALIRCDEELARRKLAAAIVLQVHDEIIFEAPDEEVPQVVDLAQEVMSGAFEMSVPLVVSIASGKTWADAKA